MGAFEDRGEVEDIHLDPDKTTVRWAARPGVFSYNLYRRDLGLLRPGGDYTNFALAEPRPELCRDACGEDPKCLAYTYVKPGIQGSRAHCWLKSSASPPKPDPNCVSGAKHNTP